MSAPDRDDRAGRRPIPPELSRLDAELAAAERRVVGRLDPGLRALVVACAVMLLLVSAVLPWAGGTSGWQVLVAGGVGVLPQAFAVTAIGFGVLGSAVGLITRRRGAAWVCAFGCGFSIFDGVLAVWSRQTLPGGGGPGVGLVLALVAVIALTTQWMRIALSQPAG